jgi:hypothetical protein
MFSRILAVPSVEVPATHITRLREANNITRPSRARRRWSPMIERM